MEIVSEVLNDVSMETDINRHASIAPKKAEVQKES